MIGLGVPLLGFVADQELKQFDGVLFVLSSSDNAGTTHLDVSAAVILIGENDAHLLSSCLLAGIFAVAKHDA